MSTIHATETRDSLIARIDDLLGRANGNRRTRTLDPGAALDRVRAVIGGEPWSFEHAGTVANAYTQAAVSTLALAARVDGRVYLGITTVDAKGTPTPGRGWTSLQPWRSGRGPAGKADGKWDAWIAGADVIEVGAGEIDALLESESD